MKKVLLCLILCVSLATNVYSAVEMAVVRNTTPSTTGTVDFEVADFGTPTGAIFFMSWGDTDGTPRTDDKYVSIGFTDGTNDRCALGNSEDGLGTSNTSRAQQNNRSIIRVSSSAFSYGAFNSWITDGVRINWNVFTTSDVMKVVCILIKGTNDVDVGTFTPNATVNLTNSVTTLSYEPDVLFFITASLTSSTGAGQSILSFGCAINDGSETQRQIMFFDQDGQSTTVVGSRLETDSCTGQFFANVVNWTGEITDFLVNGFEMTTRNGGSGNDIVYYLAMKLPDSSFDLQTLISPTSTGTVKLSTSFQTDSIISSMLNVTAIDSSSSLGVLSLGAAQNGSNEYMVGGGSVDNDTVSDTYNITDVKLINNRVNSAENTWDAEIIADVDSYNSDGITLDWTTVDATARYGWGFILGDGGTPPATTAAQVIMISG